jgi:hypothetical protein
LIAGSTCAVIPSGATDLHDRAVVFAIWISATDDVGSPEK